MKAEKFIKMINGKPRIIYPHEQIEKIVQEVENSDAGVHEVLQKYGISQSTLKRWITTYGQSQSIPRAVKFFSIIQKRQILNEIATGKRTFIEAQKHYKINETTLYYWIKRYSADIVNKTIPGNMENESSTLSSRDETRQIEDLKLKVAALETMIDMAEKEFNIPIRKKCGSKQ
jgi:transposase